MRPVPVLVSRIIQDERTQPRVELDQEVISDYAEAMAAGASFPPVVVFQDEKNQLWLADGYHRLQATSQIGALQIFAEVHKGTLRDAILYSVAANTTHGLRRTSADKRKAVTTLLSDNKWSKESDREIARITGVDHKTVGNIRGEVSGEIPQTKRKVTRNGTTYSMDITNMSKTSSPVITNTAPENNTQSASSKRVENDFYPTESGLVKLLLDNAPSILGRILEPCAGDHQISSVLENCATNEPYPHPGHRYDYNLDATDPKSWEVWSKTENFNWVVTNPPFSHAEKILPLAFEYAREGVAMLLRLSYLEPCAGRGDWLQQNADHQRYQIPVSPRPRFHGLGTDSVTVLWVVWCKSWSWEKAGIPSPFRYGRGWNETVG